MSVYCHKSSYFPQDLTCFSTECIGKLSQMSSIQMPLITWKLDCTIQFHFRSHSTPILIATHTQKDIRLVEIAVSIGISSARTYRATYTIYIIRHVYWHLRLRSCHVGQHQTNTVIVNWRQLSTCLCLSPYLFLPYLLDAMWKWNKLLFHFEHYFLSLHRFMGSDFPISFY